VIYTDFEKAFDKVSYNRLTSKLGSYGIDETLIKWARAFYCIGSIRVNLDYFFCASNE